MAPIARNDRISTVPLIDVINGQTYDFTGQAGGDIYGRAQVGFIYQKSWFYGGVSIIFFISTGDYDCLTKFIEPIDRFKLNIYLINFIIN